MACSGNTATCSCNSRGASTGTNKNIYGTTGSDARTQTSWTDPTLDETVNTKKTHLVQMQDAMKTELSIRSLSSVSWDSGEKMTWAQINQIKTAINNCRSKDNGSAFTWDATGAESVAVGSWIQTVRGYINTLQATCVCNCNYCTCNCNYCTCNCNYCTCQCNYCTCQCNCNCNYCTCDCNYCACNCNYCTCQCNHSCTCNCNYSDKRLKHDIRYFG